jgi:adenylate cyclase
LEWKTWDWRVRNFAERRASESVAILLIDQTSLTFLQREESIAWPWPRALYVPVVEYCRAAGARGVIFDILFTEPSIFGDDDDRELGASLAAGGDVVLARLGSHGDAATTNPVPLLAEGAAALGNVRFDPDADGIFRRIHLGSPADSTSSLPMAALVRLAGRRVTEDDARLLLDDAVIPTDSDGAFIVNYAGPAGTIPSYSMASAIQSFVRLQTGEEPPLPADVLAGRFVFLGMSAPGLMDLRPSPTDAVYPGVEIHATVLANLLENDLVTPAPFAATAGTCLIAALLLAALLTLVRSPVVSTLFLPLVLGAVVGGAVLAYRGGVWLPLVAPALTSVLAFVSLRTVDYATEGRQRRFLKHAFRHYLSPSVIEEILKDPDRLKLGGERKELTIFFSDVAGFTAVAEHLEPEKLAGLLNRYLTEMTDAIQEEGGTVDKYEGDAIIAFWNAPLDQSDHATRGVRAAMRCVERLRDVNPELERDFGARLSMRIGLHTGAVVVGNLGSRDRFDYTVIGDAANLASRLEGLCKAFDAEILVSEQTWQNVEGGLIAREIAAVRVVGRRTPTRIFQPVAWTADRSLFAWWRADDSFAEARAAYDRGELDAALRKFDDGSADPVAAVYRERCRTLLTQPLPDGWDGIWEMRSK